MKNWAVEKVATHFTYWFVPLTGLTAEKYDSFIELYGNKQILELSELLAKMKFLINNLRFDIDYAHQINNIYEKAKVLRDKVIPSMNK